MRLAGIVLGGLAGCSGRGGGSGGTTTPPPAIMELGCTEAVRDAVPVGSDLKKIVAEALPGETVLLGPGTFEGPIEITTYGLVLRGTCPAVSIIEGQDGSPGIRVLGGDAYIEELTVHGGAPGVEVSGQGMSATLNDVVIDGAGEQGLKVGGQATVLGADVVIRGTAGRGVTVLSASSADLTRFTISGSSGLGVHVDGATLALRESTVADTAPGAAGPGRGVHLQRDASVEIYDSVISGNTDAGIAAIDSALSVVGTTVSGTLAGADGVGDGIGFFLGTGVAARGLETSEVDLVDNARAGLIVDGEGAVAALFGGSMSGGPIATVTQDQGELTLEDTEIEAGMQTLEGLMGGDMLPVHDEVLE